MLLREDRRRHEKRHLLAILHRFKRCANGNLRLAIPHIPADQAVHDAWTLHVALGRLDGKKLVACLLKRKHLLKLLLPDRVLAKDKTLLLLTDRIELHQILCNLIDCRLDPRLGLCPFLCP